MAGTLADLMVETLKASEVRRVYGIQETRSMVLLMRYAGTVESPGSTCGTKRRRVLLREPKRHSLGSWPCAQAAAVPATCI